MNKKCNMCGKKISDHSRGLCRPCWRDSLDIEDELIKNLKSTPLNKRTNVHNHSRRKYKNKKYNKPQECAICGYKTIIEICHIKPVSEFPPETPIGVVNNIDNLIALCPNHHTEFDKGLLSIDDIQKIKRDDKFIWAS